MSKGRDISLIIRDRTNEGGSTQKNPFITHFQEIQNKGKGFQENIHVNHVAYRQLPFRVGKRSEIHRMETVIKHPHHAESALIPKTEDYRNQTGRQLITDRGSSRIVTRSSINDITEIEPIYGRIKNLGLSAAHT